MALSFRLNAPAMALRIGLVLLLLIMAADIIELWWPLPIESLAAPHELLGLAINFVVSFAALAAANAAATPAPRTCLPQ